MGLARNGFFNNAKRKMARFFVGNRSRYVELTALFLAFCADILSMSESVTGHENKTCDIALAVTPLSCIFLGSLLICCCPGHETRREGVGAAAVSVIGTSSYLISRAAVDLSLALFVKDYQDHSSSVEELIINASECGIELVYLMYALFEDKITRALDVSLSRVLAGDPEYDFMPFQI